MQKFVLEYAALSSEGGDTEQYENAWWGSTLQRSPISVVTAIQKGTNAVTGPRCLGKEKNKTKQNKKQAYKQTNPHNTKPINPHFSPKDGIMLQEKDE